MSASDDLTDTIRPRLDAAGADANRVFILPKIRDLRTDFEKLRAAVESAPDCRLVIVDPVNAYVGPSDSHFHTVVRRVLEPLAQLAAEKNLAILAVTHLRKNDGATIQRAAGSMGYVSMASTIWTVAEDPRDPSRRLFLPLKNNLGPFVGGLTFRVASTTLPLPPGEGRGEGASASLRERARSVPIIQWDETPITLSTREALARPKPPRRPTERDAAREFLRHALADGPRPANELFEEAEEQGFSPRTLQRAFHELEGHSIKKGFSAGWWWSLGEYPVQNVASWEELPPNLGGPPDYAYDVGYNDYFCRTIDMDRLRAVTGRKDLSPSAAVSPSAKSRRSPSPDPPNHLSPSADRSPSSVTDKHPTHSPKVAAHPGSNADRARAGLKTDKNAAPAGPAPSPGPAPAHSPARTPGPAPSPIPAPPRPPENDIIQKSPAAVPIPSPSSDGLFPQRTSPTIPNSIRNGADP